MQYSVLSSAWLAMSELHINKNKSRKNKLNSKGPSTDLCGISSKISDHVL